MANATTLREDFPQAAALFAECFTRPTFPAGQFAKIQGLALGAIANRTADPQAEIAELFADHLPAASPYHLVTEGKAESVRAPDAARPCRAITPGISCPKHMVVTIFGDIDPDRAVALAGKLFGGSCPARRRRRSTSGAPTPCRSRAAYHKQTGKDTGMIMLGYPCESIFQRKDHAAMTVLTAIMSGYAYPGGWLHNELREAGLVYFVQAFAHDRAGARLLHRPFADPARQGRRGGFATSAATWSGPSRGRSRRRSSARRSSRSSPCTPRRTRPSPTRPGMAALDELYGLGYDYDKTFDQRIQAVTLDDVVARGPEVSGQVALDHLAGEDGGFGAVGRPPVPRLARMIEDWGRKHRRLGVESSYPRTLP